MKAFCRRATRHGVLHACHRDRGGEEGACNRRHTRVRGGEAQQEVVEHGFDRKNGQKIRDVSPRLCYELMSSPRDGHGHGHGPSLCLGRFCPDLCSPQRSLPRLVPLLRRPLLHDLEKTTTAASPRKKRPRHTQDNHQRGQTRVLAQPRNQRPSPLSAGHIPQGIPHPDQLQDYPSPDTNNVPFRSLTPVLELTPIVSDRRT